MVEESAREIETLEDQITQIEEKLAQRTEEAEVYREILNRGPEIQKRFQTWEEAQASLHKWEEIAEVFREKEIKRQEPLMQIAAEKARLLQQVSSLETRQEELNAEQGRVPH